MSYLQLAFSLVSRDIVVDVVPAAKVPVGKGLILEGGEVSKPVYSMCNKGGLVLGILSKDSAILGPVFALMELTITAKALFCIHPGPRFTQPGV